MKKKQSSSSELEPSDYLSIMTGILDQSIDDYVKLQHPQARIKVYLQEAFLTAADFIFDDEYTMANLQDGFAQDMNTRDLLVEILGGRPSSIYALRKYAVKQCYDYWSNKDMSVLDHIPDTVTISGMLFDVNHLEGMDDFDYSIEEQFIVLDKRSTSTNQQMFLEAIVNIIMELFKTEIADYKLPVETATSIVLARELFWVLKTNNCFSYVGVPQAFELFNKPDESA